MKRVVLTSCREHYFLRKPVLQPIIARAWDERHGLAIKRARDIRHHRLSAREWEVLAFLGVYERPSLKLRREYGIDVPGRKTGSAERRIYITSRRYNPCLRGIRISRY